MFDNLTGCDVTIWHPYITKGQNRPVNVMLIGGGTTSGVSNSAGGAGGSGIVIVRYPLS
jgi:hypothetical protein